MSTSHSTAFLFTWCVANSLPNQASVGGKVTSSRATSSRVTRTSRPRAKFGVWSVGVGSINNTFGIKGVQEHTFFFKSITDANKLRRQVSECFERAALPNTSDEVSLYMFLLFCS